MMDVCKERFSTLVVDDSPVARKLVELALPSDHYALSFARTGEEALAHFAVHRPGLVISDWLMPDLSGIQLCERIRRDFPDRFTYLIILTSISDKSEIVRALQAGADEYLTKPFHPEELAARAEVGRRIVQLHREIEAKNRLLEQLALTDPLTGLPNRRALGQWAMRQMSGSVRHNFSFWLIACDLDNFKSVNDTHGHEAGDTVLCKLAETLQINTRQCDICGRIGGDEFVLAITHSPEDGIRVAVDHIREEIQSLRFHFPAGDVRVTASFGIAGFDRSQPADFEQLLAQADSALYSAKRLGRNRVHSLAEIS
jgi:two-component system, cell cycle response regulator